MRFLKYKIICCLLLSVTFGYSQDAMQQHSNDTLPVIAADTLFQIVDTIAAPIMDPPIKADSVIMKDSLIMVDSMALTDSIVKKDSVIMKESIVIVEETKELPMTLKLEEFKPNPTKALIYSAIFPGLGQIYNRKYWKLPIVYGGFLGFTYAITWNGKYYKDYSNGYKDIMDEDPETDSWKNFLPYGVDPESVDQAWLTDVMKRRKDFYRRYRDLSIIGTVAMYALSMLDAYVDAQLFDFNISSDLSLRVEPALIQKTDFFANSLGVQCRVSF